MKRLLLMLVFATILAGTAAQPYKIGIGIRAGLAPGVSVKYFLNESSAIEGILHTRWQGHIITALYEYQRPAFGSEEFDLFLGVGGHVGIWGDYYENMDWLDPEEYPDGITIYGADIVLGIAYTFDMLPVNIAFDWKPAWNFAGYEGFWWGGGGLTVRWAIK